MVTTTLSRLLGRVVGLMLLAVGVAQATDVSRIPLQAEGLAKPNVIFGMDDSGSMDFEVLLKANDGALWWSSSRRSAWESNGTPLFSATDSADAKYAYLFPNGCGSSGQRHLCDSNGHYAIPPTAQFASLRSSDYNTLYYNSSVTYAPWSSAAIGDVFRSFTDSSASAAKTHPLFNVTFKLDGVQSSTSSDYVFLALPGMKLPVGTTVRATSATSGACRGSTTRVLTEELTVATGYSCFAAIPYYPATFWVKQNCTVDNETCATAPDGSTLRRYEIKPGTSFPSGRSYAAELQNFANWFTYYRKRRLMLAASMGRVMDTLKGMRVGVVAFNNQSVPTMYDTDSTDDLAGGKAVAGRFYANLASGGTPTRQTLKYIGDQFLSNRNVIQYSCQRNAAFIVTDGFAVTTTTTPPDYDASIYGRGAPYETTYGGTLADIALSYYTNRLRTDLPEGKVPAAAQNNPNPAADKNKNLHMNTYAITLGAGGTLWPARTNAYGSPITWPNPNASQSPTSIDDLWHATVNGRGSMFLATNPTETASATQAALTEILSAVGAQNGISFSTVNLSSTDSVAYVGSFRPQGWSGEVAAHSVNTTSGALGDQPVWSAAAQLEARDWSGRHIATYGTGGGTPFTAAAIGSLVNPGGVYGNTADLVAYLRGDRSKESSTYRVRSGLMGAVVNAEPVAWRAEGVVFAATNDGMLHAFDKANGKELWAYVPGSVLGSMGAQSQRTWAFQTLLDGTPVLGSVQGKTILVGGRGTAGTGYYALDVTGAKTLTEAGVAGRVLWEFPNASTSAAIRAAMGASMGRPVVMRTAKYGSVVLVTSGYNSTLDGKGRVFVLDALTGTVRHEFIASDGAAGDAGLAQVSGFTEADGTVRYVYGGDERGNLWRFDIESGGVLLLATLKAADGSRLPVTAAPELAKVNNRPMVFIGTGRLLGMSDFSDSSRNSFFALWDNGTAIGDVRTQLAPRTLTEAGGVRRATGAAIDWRTKRGWYVDMPAGEKANTDPAIAYGVVAWTTNQPSASSCSSSSVLYIADAATGLEIPSDQFTGDPYFGRVIAPTMASRAVISRLPNGSIVITTHQSDNSTKTEDISIRPMAAPRKTGWKQVLR